MALQPPVSDRDHRHGSLNAAVELLEYGDYQCPYCGRAYPVVKAIQRQMGENLKFVFRNFPLTKIHPQAKIAALATEAAGLQGKFWEMHDIVFENQRRLFKNALCEYARRLDLKLDQFEADLDDKTLIGKVEADFESGLRSGVNATPSFFVNGEKFRGDWSTEELSIFVEMHLEKAGKLNLWPTG